jgi:hypothetical protein
VWLRAWYGDVLPDDLALLRAATAEAVRRHAEPSASQVRVPR